MATAVSTTPTIFNTEADMLLPSGQRTDFIIRPLTSREKAKLADMSTDDNEAAIRNETLMYGLLGWNKFKYQDNTPCKFGSIMEDNISHISAPDREEIIDAIIALG